MYSTVVEMECVENGQKWLLFYLAEFDMRNVNSSSSCCLLDYWGRAGFLTGGRRFNFVLIKKCLIEIESNIMGLRFDCLYFTDAR